METLNSDEKMLILMKLSGEEIIKVCQTSKEMSRICNDKRYNPLWQKKIKEEFDVDYFGENGFNKYHDLKLLYATKFYTVLIVDTHYAEDSNSISFLTREQAEDYIATSLEYDYTYSQIRTALLHTGYVKIGDVLYTIEEDRLKHFNFRNSHHRIEYEINKQKFFSLFGEYDAEKTTSYIDEFNDAFTDINSDIDAGLRGEGLNQKINSHVETIVENYEMEAHREEIEKYIRDNILIA